MNRSTLAAPAARNATPDSPSDSRAALAAIGTALHAFRMRLERFDGEFESAAPLLDQLDHIRADVHALETGLPPARILQVIQRDTAGARA